MVVEASQVVDPRHLHRVMRCRHRPEWFPLATGRMNLARGVYRITVGEAGAGLGVVIPHQPRLFNASCDGIASNASRQWECASVR
jgi:hypothetical protein